MHSFWTHILGTSDLGFYAAKWAFAILGIALSLGLHSLSRNPASLHTPEKFSLKFLLADNWKRLLVSFLLMFLFLRFPFQLLMAGMGHDGEGWQLFLATIAGFIHDKLAEVLKTYDFLGMSRIRKRLLDENTTHVEASPAAGTDTDPGSTPA